ncbi:MAG: hypothetical protein WBL29_19140 [Burkholderiales bacterium]
MSITVAAALEGVACSFEAPLPPTCRIRPTSNIAAVEVGPVFGRRKALKPVLKLPTVLVAPRPFGSSDHILSAEIPKTRPFGATHIRGYHQRLRSGPNASRLVAPGSVLQPAPGV